MRTVGRESFGFVNAGAAAVVVAACVLPALAHTENDTTDVPPQPESRAAGPDITGRDFGGIRFDIAPQRGALEFRAARADVWSEPASPAPVTRLLLSGDTEVRLGAYRFSARNAVVWLQRITEANTGGAATYQVFVFFDHVGTPAADAAVAVSAERLSVRAIIIPDTGVKLVADARREGRPADALVTEGEAVLSRTLRPPAPPAPAESRAAIAGRAPRVSAADAGITLAPPDGAAAAEARTSAEIRDLLNTLPSESAAAPIFAQAGVISISTGNWTLVTGAEENAALVTGGVTVEYDDLRAGKSLQITGERAVIFLAPGKTESIARMKREDVLGVYMEGDVVAIASGGRYTLRGPRIYYDLQSQKAVILDAVFWTYDQQRRLPLYLRADTIRQEAERQFTAESATIATSAFFEPQFSLGSTTLTITGAPREPVEAGATAAASDQIGYFVDAHDITLRAGSFPFFYFPRFSGYPDQIPLRDLRLENSSSSGSALKTTWNLYGLLGIQKPDGATADLLLDAYFERGFAAGARFGWGDKDSRGQLFGYGLPADSGTDLLKPGTTIERDDQTRGIVLAEHMQRLDENWSLLLEGSYISDESFIDAFMEQLGETRREFTSRGYLRRLDENTALTGEVKGTFNDFIANEYLLQSPGYVVQKLPEFTYTRQADDLFEGVAPGLISYFSEYRVSRMEMAFDEPLARERGFSTNPLAQRAFGINADQSIAQRLTAQGLRESTVNRFDTRHEFTSPLMAGPVNITPFAVGRITAYDNDFEAYSPNEGDKNRLWGSIGATAATTIQRVDDSFDSHLLNMHRLRHIMQPHATVMIAGSNIDRVDLPVYDRGVEDIAEGTLSNFGLSNTFQTQRGGPGRWHSVDILVFNTNFSFASDDADRASPIGRWVDYRPELSNPGDYMTNDARWQVSGTIAIVGSSVFDLDTNQQSRSNLGAIVEHFPGFSTSIEVRNIHPDNSTNLDLGAAYEMTSKYTIAGNVVFDLNEGGIQTISGEIRRRFPGVLFGVGVTYNDITNETSLGFVFQPEGFKGQGARFGGLGATDERSRTSGIGGT